MYLEIITHVILSLESVMRSALCSSHERLSGAEFSMAILWLHLCRLSLVLFAVGANIL